MPWPKLQQTHFSFLQAADTTLYIASCAGYQALPSSVTGAPFTGFLAGTHLINRAVTLRDLASLMRGTQVSGALYSASATHQHHFPNVTVVPSQPAQPDVAAQWSDTEVCALLSPTNISVVGIPKPASLSSMAWIQLADTPRHKEACILSHGSWEKGWKFSMCVSGGACHGQTLWN